MSNKEYKLIKKTLWLVLFANLTVATIKICIGIACNSQSIIADGIHSFADGASNIVGLIGIWLASKPKDEQHPYGHGRYEIIASFFIGIMLAVMSVRIISRSLMSFQDPVSPNTDLTELLLLAITIVINISVAFTEYRCGKKLGSTVLITDSLHTRGDIFISGTVLFVLAGVRSGCPAWIDPVMSFIVAIAVFISAWQIIRSCTDVLVDSSIVKSDEVKKMLMLIPGICDIHQIRSRGESNHVFIDMHVVVSPDDDIGHTHQLSHMMENILKEHFGKDTEVNIHFEPDDGQHEKSIR